MAMTLIGTIDQTSGTSAINITSGIDSTYKLYIVKIINLHPASDGQTLQFKGSSDGASSFVNMTSTHFYSQHTDADATALTYYAAGDQQNSTPSSINFTLGNDADQNLSGEIFLFNPAGTTFAKDWIGRTAAMGEGDWVTDNFASGYWNTTSAINAVGFSMTSGNIDAAVIKLYGVG